MNWLGIGNIIDGVGKIADDLITTDEEKLQLALREREMDVALIQGQIETNKAEASHGSIFVAGWRPFIGWVGGLALAYQFLVYPLLVWGWAIMQAYNIIPCHLDPVTMTQSAVTASTMVETVMAKCSFTPPPTLPGDALFAIVTGMLGIGGMRSYDKMKNTDTKRVTHRGS